MSKPKIVQFDYTPSERQARFHDCGARQILYGGSAMGGKALHVETPILTPDGWTTMGRLAVGDEVFGRDGRPTTVVAVSEVMENRPVFELEFDDGEKIVADILHEWLTFTAADLVALSSRDETRRAMRRAKRASRVGGKKSARFTAAITERNRRNPPRRLPPPVGSIKTTLDIYGSMLTRKGRRNHAVPVMWPALDMRTKALPLDPYILGAWLGDGASAGGTITIHPDDVPHFRKQFAQAGFVLTDHSSKFGHGIPGVTSLLRILGVLNDKHIPDEYLFGDEVQRLALLQGLMDTDGTVAKPSGCAEFCNTNKSLAEGVHFLAASLGLKPSIREGRAKLDGRDCGPKWTVKFMSSIPMFRLARKANLQKRPKSRRVAFRYLVRCREVPKVPVRCIKVDAPDQLFLCGRGLIPTHNSKALRMDAVLACIANPGLDAYLFRRTLPELENNHIRSLKMEVPQELATYNETRKRLQFFNGAGINFCYCEREDDVTRYQGAEMHWLGLDEATHFTEFQIAYLKSRNRIGSFKPSDAWKGSLPRCVMASNPGGPGHSYLKSIFIDQAPPETLFFDRTMAEPTFYPKGWPSIFIPAKMQDNIYKDPGYEGSFGGLPDELRRALMEGDWDAVVGQAIPVSRERHRLRPFNPPRWWTRIMAIDWGTFHPFSVGWYCVAEKSKLEGRDGWPDVFIPDGAVIRYREWYGWNGKPNQGCRLDGRSVARKILEIEKAENEVIDYRIADSGMWSTQDGPSVAENMMKEGQGRFTLRSTGGKDRAANYAEICARLAGLPDTGPMFYVTANCTHFWRTVPILTFDETNPEKGPDTKLEDHVYDECVYLLRSRPFRLSKEDRYLASIEPFLAARKGPGARDPYATR